MEPGLRWSWEAGPLHSSRTGDLGTGGARSWNHGAGGRRNRVHIAVAKFTAKAALAGSWDHSPVDKGRHISGRAMGGNGGRFSAGSSGLGIQRRDGGGRINV